MSMSSHDALEKQRPLKTPWHFKYQRATECFKLQYIVLRVCLALLVLLFSEAWSRSVVKDAMASLPLLIVCTLPVVRGRTQADAYYCLLGLVCSGV